MLSIDDYNEIKECTYKGEHYSVRDNGAIMRHQRIGMRKRKLDYVWTFGNLNPQSGYMELCGERVHRIVATAFHGVSPSDQHVVDHIDTNRQNNRPENLRWLTRIENVLKNEITRKKVELICGSVEAFLNNPQLLWGYETEDKNFTWMKNVTKEEAQNCLENWNHWAKTAKPDSNYKKREKQIGDWIYNKPITIDDNPFMNRIPTGYGGYKTIDVGDSKSIVEDHYGQKNEKDNDDISDSLTPSAVQRYWSTPTVFPCCPAEVTDNGLKVYKDNLKEGELFSSNKLANYYVIDKAIIPKKNDLIVLCTNNAGENVFGTYALCSIKIENGKFVHMSIRRYGSKKMATRFFKLIIGEEEWTNDDLIMWDT